MCAYMSRFVNFLISCVYLYYVDKHVHGDIGLLLYINPKHECKYMFSVI